LENGAQRILVCASSSTTYRDNDKRVMRGEAEIDAKSSKIDDQKFQNSLRMSRVSAFMLTITRTV
jgi:hypothetical protein